MHRVVKSDIFFHYTTVKVTDLMVNMREILYWYLDNKKSLSKLLLSVHLSL